MKYIRTILLLGLFTVLTIVPVYSQISDGIAKIIEEYDRTRNIAPREKLYVHFDKALYLQQDTIWFKAYLVNATLLSYSKASGLIYTDIINAKGEVVETLSLPTNLGLAWGAFTLAKDKYPAGKYTFRAYTNWMKNFGDVHLFKKEITIVSDEIPLNNKQPVLSSANPNKQKNTTDNKIENSDIDIQFLPEGGVLLPSIKQKIAFKAIDKSGRGIAVSGEILDPKENLITKFKSNLLGMGTFEIIPEAAVNYSARITTNSDTYTKNLPRPIQSATTIRLGQYSSNDSLLIEIFSTLPNQPLFIIGQARGVQCFVASLNANIQSSTLKFAKNIFPTGVAQIIIMNQKKEILNERNFFVDLDNQLSVNVSSKENSYRNRDSIPLQITAADFKGNPTFASFSIAVTDDSQVNKDPESQEHILSYLLLSSDLKGTIENSGYYFNKKNETSTDDLDALMLTQGWVSYSWTNNRPLSFKAEKEYTITGKVTNAVGKPSADAKIILLGRNKSNLILDTLTNQQGEFSFDQFPLIDSATFIIQALNTKGKSGTLGIEVNTFERPPVTIVEQKNSLQTRLLDSTITEQIVSKNKVNEAILKNGIMLKEVNITGRKAIKGSKNLNGAGLASQIVTEQDLIEMPKKTLIQALQEKVSGFGVQRKRDRSFDSFYSIKNNITKFIIDGIDLDLFYEPPVYAPSPSHYFKYITFCLNKFNAEDISGIEVMYDGYSFKYQNRFMNPADDSGYSFVEITTKTGSGPFAKKTGNIYILNPVNYGSNKTFYSPKYPSNATSSTLPDYRSTVYWNPNVVTNENGEAAISFYATDRKGTYTVWIEGTDTNGSFGFSTLKLTVK